MNGGLEIGFDACPRSGRTRLAHLDQRAPLRALFPLCTGMDLPVAVTTSTSGGFAGGDRMDMALQVGARASAMGTSQAAEKFYRSSGADTEIAVRLDVEDGGWLEWLPQESILFNGARLKRRVPPEFIPALLDRARQNSALRTIVIEAGGERASWLAAENPNWSFAAVETPDTWDTGTKDQRLALLRTERATTPAAARAKIEAAWKSEPADIRAAWSNIGHRRTTAVRRERCRSHGPDRGAKGRSS